MEALLGFHVGFWDYVTFRHGCDPRPLLVNWLYPINF